MDKRIFKDLEKHDSLFRYAASPTDALVWAIRLSNSDLEIVAQYFVHISHASVAIGRV
jgi:hypothetical protein